MAQVHGGRLVSKALKRHGTTHLFTLCGGHIQAIYDGCLDDDIRVVDVRHEQTAGHAADGYARVSGRPAAAFVITNAESSALHLPDLSGLTLARRLRATPGPVGSMPIVLFGDAWDPGRILESCREARLDGYLPKPLSIGRGLVRRMNEGPVALTLKSSYLLVTSKEKTHAIHDADVAQGV